MTRYQCDILLGRGNEGAVHRAKTEGWYRDVIGADAEFVAVKTISKPFAHLKELKRLVREIVVNKSLARCPSTNGLVARWLDVHLADGEDWTNYTKL